METLKRFGHRARVIFRWLLRKDNRVQQHTLWYTVFLPLELTIEFFRWAFVRLPKTFVIPLALILAVQFGAIFPWLMYRASVMLEESQIIDFADEEDQTSEKAVVPINPSSARESVLTWKKVKFILTETVTYIGWLLLFLLMATSILILAASSLLFSWWLAGEFYLGCRRLTGYLRHRRTELNPALVESGELEIDEIVPLHERAQNNENPLKDYKRIGIILSGGGAKGAYQAGALKAIYEYLDEHGALGKVKLIAGTSIGSWNALFWLAGLMKSNGGENRQGENSITIEEWWTQVNVEKIVQPVSYVPARQNFLLSNEPWRKSFDTIFGTTDKPTKAGRRLLRHVKDINDKSGNAIRFYFTRSNIGKGELAYSTNERPADFSAVELTADSNNGDSSKEITLDEIRDGVFCSMDIPPLFEYGIIKKDFFEDGGVIDNLPTRFGTEFENCDLLFILPLNASFERDVNRFSVFKRLARVTEIRQGVLERNSLKMVELYNELAALRRTVEKYEQAFPDFNPFATNGEANEKMLSEEQMARRARKRDHAPVHIFAICPKPEPKIKRLKINTIEFWKTKEAGEAFHFMYAATKNELKMFGKIVNHREVLMTLVAPGEADSGDGTVIDGRAATEKLKTNTPIQKTYVNTIIEDGKEIEKEVLYNVTYSNKLSSDRPIVNDGARQAVSGGERA